MKLLFFGIFLLGLIIAPNAHAAARCSPSECAYGGTCYGDGAILKQSDDQLHICKAGHWTYLPPQFNSQTIVFDSAVYGCFCGNRASVIGAAIASCKANTSLTPNGETCRVSADNHQLGDPGPNQVPKFLTINYHCELNGFTVEGSGRQTQVREGQVAQLVCPKPQ